MKQKLIKNRWFLLNMNLFFLMSFTIIVQASSVFGTSKTIAPAKPVFSSSFIQHWYCEDFDEARWKQELTMLQKMGVNEIILQAIAYTDVKYTTYPTAMPGYRHNDIDMLQNALTAADSLSMKVRIGLAFNNAWWDKNAMDMAWLDNEASANKTIVDEVAAKYGSHPSLNGWYIPYEFTQTTALTVKQQDNLNSFFKQIASEIILKSPGKDIMISPFYNGKYSWFTPLTFWSQIVENVLKGTNIDILALQDAVGADYNNTNQLADIFSYTKKAADKLGIKLYSVTETFTSTASGNIPAAPNTILTQLSIEKPFVQSFVAFSLSHYQNANKPSQLDYSNEYYDYYLANK